MNKKRIFVTGHRGLVGSAIVRRLTAGADCEIVTRSHPQLDLQNQTAVERFFRQTQIDLVYLAAGMVGGIHANSTFPAEFIYKNLMIECNVIQAAHASGVQELLFLGSSCIYPKMATQPIAERSPSHRRPRTYQ